MDNLKSVTLQHFAGSATTHPCKTEPQSCKPASLSGVLVEFRRLDSCAGVASARGLRRSLRRGFLCSVYVVKERCLGFYDGLADILNCQKRRQLQWRRECCVASFRTNSGALAAARTTKPMVYDFTEFQHGEPSDSLPEAD
ncbi:gly-6 [Symbiodinium necroappetens]|uniref:Gly-6 protein n=1 Tax=Symbiodinium necroappetens TaxID=1628268 RepID=A0A812R123_9DINO|nr:gly-6 [Symbiodinium necroappetens]